MKRKVGHRVEAAVDYVRYLWGLPPIRGGGKLGILIGMTHANPWIGLSAIVCGVAGFLLSGGYRLIVGETLPTLWTVLHIRGCAKTGILIGITIAEPRIGLWATGCGVAGFLLSGGYRLIVGETLSSLWAVERIRGWAKAGALVGIIIAAPSLGVWAIGGGYSRISPARCRFSDICEVLPQPATILIASLN